MTHANQSLLSKDFDQITPLPEVLDGIQCYRAIRRRDDLHVLIKRIGDTRDQASRLRLREEFRRENELGTRLLTHAPWQADWPLVIMLESRPSEQTAEYYIITIDPGDELLSQRLQKPIRLTKTEIRCIAQDLVRAVEIHGQAGIIHLHITPEHVYLKRDAAGAITGAFLAGYGQAIDTEAQRVPTDLNHSYTAPELFEQRKPAIPVHDLYSIGALIGIIIGYQKPLQSNDIAKMSDRSEQERAMLAPLVARACDSDPQLRYDNGADLLADLARYGDAPIPKITPIAAQVPVVPSIAPILPTSRKQLIVIGCAILLFFSIILFVFRALSASTSSVQATITPIQPTLVATLARTETAVPVISATVPSQPTAMLVSPTQVSTDIPPEPSAIPAPTTRPQPSKTPLPITYFMTIEKQLAKAGKATCIEVRIIKPYNLNTAGWQLIAIGFKGAPETFNSGGYGGVCIPEADKEFRFIIIAPKGIMLEGNTQAARSGETFYAYISK